MEQTIEGNKLIAEFEGWKFFDDDKESYPNGYMVFESEDEKHWSTIENLEYHTSLDWLMPVVEKFEKLGCEFVISTGSIIITWDDGTAYYDRQFVNSKGKLPILHEMITKLIKWYNENKK